MHAASFIFPVPAYSSLAVSGPVDTRNFVETGICNLLEAVVDRRHMAVAVELM